MNFTLIVLGEFALGLAILFIAVIRFIKVKPRLRLPPGPRGLPVIGNVLDMPSEKEWLTFAQWGETWGDICSVNVLGQPLILLNSAKAAFEMLDKKSAIYSDRPTLQMGGELVGWKNTLVLLPYGERFRRYRRLFHQSIGTTSAMSRFLPIQEQEARRFIRGVLAKPEDLSKQIRLSAGAVVLKIAYGHEIKGPNDPFVRLAGMATEQFSAATAPGGWLVDMIPALKRLPTWFPGAGFLNVAEAWNRTLVQMVEQPFQLVKRQLAAGVAPISVTSTLLKQKGLTAEEEFDIKWSVASMYSGGADTTVSAIYAFFLAMAMNPVVAKKAQAEIDAVVGTERLPSFTDRDRLPYVNALALEVFRWNSVVPTAAPHRVMQDDVHEGYFIPKGALVIPNIWLADFVESNRKMTHDPRTYKSPLDFNPDRFLPIEGVAEPDPRKLCFGFGRRRCPGAHLADAALFITISTVLAVFDISKHVENGVVIEPTFESTTGTISHPKPFKCSIKPRSEKAVHLIQQPSETSQ